MSTGPVIRLQNYSFQVLTWEEYEEIRNEILAKKLVGDTTLGDRILARLLLDVESRYHEVKAHYHPELYKVED